MSMSASSYTYLDNLLATQQWKKADDETARIMLRIAQREAEDWLDCDSIARFPCDDLVTIDKLWMQHSNNHFGINIWKDLWLRFGAIVDDNMEHRIGEVVGWYENGWKFADKIDYSLSAPVGHLPYLFQAKRGTLLRLLGCSEMMHSALAWRFKNCSSSDSGEEQVQSTRREVPIRQKPNVRKRDIRTRQKSSSAAIVVKNCEFRFGVPDCW